MAAESIEEMLVRHEGEVLHAYQDSEGYWTIGVGILIDKRRGGGITQEESRYLLRNRINKAANEAMAFPWYDNLNNSRKQVIINMIFNMGLPTFSQCRKMHTALSVGNYNEAANQMLDSKWATQVKGRATELAQIMRNGEMA